MPIFVIVKSYTMRNQGNQDVYDCQENKLWRKKQDYFDARYEWSGGNLSCRHKSSVRINKKEFVVDVGFLG
jgi:hypothetical protein